MRFSVRRVVLVSVMAASVVVPLAVALADPATASPSGRAGAQTSSSPSQEDELTTTTTSAPVPEPSLLDEVTFGRCAEVIGLVGYASTNGIDPLSIMDEDQQAFYAAVNAQAGLGPLNLCALASVQGQVGGGLAALNANEGERHTELLAALSNLPSDSGESGGLDSLDLQVIFALGIVIVFSLGVLVVQGFK